MTLISIYSIQPDEFLSACLNSLDHSVRSKFVVDLFIVSATPVGLQWIEKYSFPVNIWTLSSVKPYAQIANLSFRRAMEKGYKNVMLLNSDTIVHPECIYNLNTIMSLSDKNGVLGGFQVKYGMGWDQPNQWMENMLTTSKYKEILKHRNKSYTLIGSEYAQGACMIINLKCLNTVGCFNESFKLFYEETEFCRRVINSNLRVAILKEAKVQHFEGGSWKKSKYLKIKRDIYYLSNQVIYEATDSSVTDTNILLKIIKIIKKQVKNVIRKNDNIYISLFLYPLVLVRILLKVPLLMSLYKLQHKSK